MKDPVAYAREQALEAVEIEAMRGLGKFPKPLDYPDGTRAGGMNLGQRDRAQDSCRRAEREGYCNWALILAEEFWEAMCEEDPAKLRAELIQVAAVAANWLAHIDVRGTGRPVRREPLLDLARTAEAYAVWKAGDAGRYADMMAADTNLSIEKSDENERVAWRKVTDAFAKDTADRNAPDRAALADRPFIEGLLAEWKARR